MNAPRVALHRGRRRAEGLLRHTSHKQGLPLLGAALPAPLKGMLIKDRIISSLELRNCRLP
ncbi:hypothetical protein SAMCFNEI73_pC1302 (plasmid) [Sinorhizobium americanum]|uniref:Uncharacterized protein n=1 Tax=Sinorhizobium americanum TaxID=194963 RepID=A0A1L3LY23_9HYPH|nr:hypothetical protein SAMCFNEI73_pC1302 [Sinorhizobium americanum]